MLGLPEVPSIISTEPDGVDNVDGTRCRPQSGRHPIPSAMLTEPQGCPQCGHPFRLHPRLRTSMLGAAKGLDNIDTLFVIVQYPRPGAQQGGSRHRRGWLPLEPAPDGSGAAQRVPGGADGHQGRPRQLRGSALHSKAGVGWQGGTWASNWALLGTSRQRVAQFFPSQGQGSQRTGQLGAVLGKKTLPSSPSTPARDGEKREEEVLKMP